MWLLKAVFHTIYRNFSFDTLSRVNVCFLGTDDVCHVVVLGLLVVLCNLLSLLLYRHCNTVLCAVYYFVCTVVRGLLQKESLFSMTFPVLDK